MLHRNPNKIKEWEKWKANVREFCSRSEACKGLKGFLETAKVPTVIIKEEDVESLKDWETAFDVPIFIFHVFW